MATKGYQEVFVEVGALQWLYREAQPINLTQQLPVVLLHGIVAQSYSWRNVLPALAEKGFRAIAPDWLGFGFSAKPDRRKFAYTPDAYVQALGDFLQTLGIDRCHLIAQGFIGSAGIQYALRYPDQVDRLAIINAPIAPENKLPWKIKQLGIPLVGEMLTQDPLLVDRTLEGGGGYRVEDTDLDVYRRPFLKSSDAGRALFAAVQNLQLSKAIAEIHRGLQSWNHPTLIAWGDRDPWLPIDAAKAVAQTLPNGKFAVLEAVGHYPQEDWHEKVSQELITFLRQQI